MMTMCQWEGWRLFKLEHDQSGNDMSFVWRGVALLAFGLEMERMM